MAKSINGLLPMHRRVLADLVDGAVLIRRFGKHETYREIDGKVRPCGNGLQAVALDELLVAVPELEPLRGDLGRDVLRLPAAHRATYADALQTSMPLRDLIEDLQPVERPRMRGNFDC